MSSAGSLPPPQGIWGFGGRVSLAALGCACLGSEPGPAKGWGAASPLLPRPKKKQLGLPWGGGGGASWILGSRSGCWAKVSKLSVGLRGGRAGKGGHKERKAGSGEDGLASDQLLWTKVGCVEDGH